MKHNRRWYDQPRWGRLCTLAFVVIVMVILSGCAGLTGGTASTVMPDGSRCSTVSVPVRDRITNAQGKTTGYVERWERRTYCH